MLNFLFGWFACRAIDNYANDALEIMEKQKKDVPQSITYNGQTYIQVNQQNNVIISKEEYLKLKRLK